MQIMIQAHTFTVVRPCSLPVFFWAHCGVTWNLNSQGPGHFRASAYHSHGRTTQAASLDSEVEHSGWKSTLD